jgi:hypothetical protein
MWNQMKNLICAEGHWHYSPKPGVFSGRACLYRVGENERARCQAKLRRGRHEQRT